MSFTDYLDPSPVVKNPSPKVEEEFRKGWRDYLSDPTAQAALLSFGAQMLQPLGVGQTFMGQLGQAIGKAGEAAGTQRKAEREQEEARLRAEQNEIDRQYRREATDIDRARLEQQNQQFMTEQERMLWQHQNPNPGASTLMDRDTVIRIGMQAGEDHDNRIKAIRTAMASDVGLYDNSESEEQPGKTNAQVAQEKWDAQIAAEGSREQAIQKAMSDAQAIAQSTMPTTVDRGPEITLQDLVAKGRKSGLTPADTAAARRQVQQSSVRTDVTAPRDEPKPLPEPTLPTPPAAAAAPAAPLPSFNDLLMSDRRVLPLLIQNSKANPALARQQYERMRQRSSDGANMPSFEDWIANVGGATGF